MYCMNMMRDRFSPVDMTDNAGKDLVHQRHCAVSLNRKLETPRILAQQQTGVN